MRLFALVILAGLIGCDRTPSTPYNQSDIGTNEPVVSGTTTDANSRYTREFCGTLVEGGITSEEEHDYNQCVSARSIAPALEYEKRNNWDHKHNRK